MFQKLEEVEKRYEEVTKKISDPEVISKQEEWKALMKEHAEIEPVVLKYREYKKANQAIEDAKAMLNDPEMKELAELDLEENKEKLPKLEEEIKTLKGGGTTATAEGENTQQNNNENSNSNSSEANTDDPGNFDWYTVTESDNSWWTLAQRFYGDGTQYTRILEANGKTENDYLRAGDKLKIPKK